MNSDSKKRILVNSTMNFENDNTAHQLTMLRQYVWPKDDQAVMANGLVSIHGYVIIEKEVTNHYCQRKQPLDRFVDFFKIIQSSQTCYVTKGHN